MLSILCVRLTIKVKVGIPESFKVGWYPPQKKTGSSHLKRKYSEDDMNCGNTNFNEDMIIAIVIAILTIANYRKSSIIFSSIFEGRRKRGGGWGWAYLV